MTVVAVDDPSDPRLADYVGLRHRRLESSDFFIVETVVPIRRLLASPYPVRSVLVTPEKLDLLSGHLACCSAPVFVLDEAAMAEVVGFDIHRGAMASAQRLPAASVAEVVAAKPARILMVEGCADHENLGAMARSARAAGVDALVTDATSVDPLYRRSVRVSMGEVLRLQLGRCPSTIDAVDQIHAAGIATWALTPSSDAEVLWDSPIPERLAVLVGREGPGLSDGALRAAQRRVRIPIHPDVDSFNAAHAAAIALAWASTLRTHR
jgi:tRNA G18 (ribose-2'-O)-methylase SpoU